MKTLSLFVVKKKIKSDPYRVCHKPYMKVLTK